MFQTNLTISNFFSGSLIHKHKSHCQKKISLAKLKHHLKKEYINKITNEGHFHLFSHIYPMDDFIHLNNSEFLQAALITALNKATKTHMKNLDIYRGPLKYTKALFCFLFLEQQPFTILSICCTMEMLIVTLRLYLIF